jgi:hypothetical protein
MLADRRTLMLVAIDPVEHSVCGLTGGVHNDYRSEIIGKQELGRGLWRIYLRLVDDMAKPDGAKRRPTLSATVIVPHNLQYHYACRREMWKRIEQGGSLVDITIY